MTTYTVRVPPMDMDHVWVAGPHLSDMLGKPFQAGTCTGMEVRDGDLIVTLDCPGELAQFDLDYAYSIGWSVEPARGDH